MKDLQSLGSKSQDPGVVKRSEYTKDTQNQNGDQNRVMDGIQLGSYPRRPEVEGDYTVLI